MFTLVTALKKNSMIKTNRINPAKMTAIFHRAGPSLAEKLSSLSSWGARVITMLLFSVAIASCTTVFVSAAIVFSPQGAGCVGGCGNCCCQRHNHPPTQGGPQGNEDLWNKLELNFVRNIATSKTRFSKQFKVVKFI